MSSTLFFISPTNVELITHAFKKQFNSTFPHHFEIQSRTLLDEQYANTNFNFVNGYLSTSYFGGSYYVTEVSLWDRIEELYPEW